MGTEFPFDEYAEVQKLPVIDVEFSHLVGMDACQGTLTLLDRGPFRQYAQNMAQIRFRIDTVQTAGACFSGNKQESQR